MAEDLVDGFASGATAIRKLLSWVEGGLRTKKIPVEDYAEFAKAELAAAIEKNTFKGMANAGPNPDNEDQVELPGGEHWPSFWLFCKALSQWLIFTGQPQKACFKLHRHGTREGPRSSARRARCAASA